MQPATMYHGGRLCPGLLLNLSSAADREQYGRLLNDAARVHHCRH